MEWFRNTIICYYVSLLAAFARTDSIPLGSLPTYKCVEATLHVSVGQIYVGSGPNWMKYLHTEGEDVRWVIPKNYRIWNLMYLMFPRPCLSGELCDLGLHHQSCSESLLWCHNGHGSVSNHQPHDCLLNRLFRPRSKKISKLSVTGLCAGTSPGTGAFLAQMASNAENVSIWWRHHDIT